MRNIRLLKPHEYEEFTTISAYAYPGIDLFGEADRQRFQERIERAVAASVMAMYGIFEGEQMRGVMRLYDFTMRVLSVDTLVGGVGGVAVDLLHKKEHLAYDMIQFFLQHYKAKGACMTALYPFRPDFYKRMGFGYGAKMRLYAVEPAALPQTGGPARVEVMTKAEIEAVSDCYNRYVAKTNGLMARPELIWKSLFDNTGLHAVGVRDGARVVGYLIYKFAKGRQKDNFLSNDMVVIELVYESPAALAELLNFLHLQRDQIENVRIYTQEEDFHYLLRDPRDSNGRLYPDKIYHESNLEGVGIMYRVIDVPRLFTVLSDHDFNGQTCRLKITISDSFFPENAGSTTVVFENGRARLAPSASHDAEIQLDVSDFSSLVTGAVGFQRLHTYGRAQLSDPAYLSVIDRIFAAPAPLCMTGF